jgi:hypothetical protein
VVEDEESGVMCLVALRDIASGDFLSIAADEESEEEDDEGDRGDDAARV